MNFYDEENDLSLFELEEKEFVIPEKTKEDAYEPEIEDNYVPEGEGLGEELSF